MALAQDTYADSSASDYQSLIAHVATNLGSGNPFGVEASAFAVLPSTEAHSIADATQTDSNGDALVAEAQALAGTTATQQFDDEQAEQSADTDQQSAQQAFDQAMTQVGSTSRTPRRATISRCCCNCPRRPIRCGGDRFQHGLR